MQAPSIISSRSPKRQENEDLAKLKERVRALRDARHSQLRICQELDKDRRPFPPNAAWQAKGWAEAYRNLPRVKTWLSKAYKN
jgi:hypothetical protein